MGVAVKPWGGVAQTSPTVNAPMAQVTRAPATISFKVFLFMVIPPSGRCAARKLAAAGCSALLANGAAGCGRPAVGRHLPLLQSDDDSGPAGPSPAPRPPAPPLP